MDGHFSGALEYMGNITLLSPSVSGLRTLSEVCEEYATEFDVIFNGNKSQLLFLRSRECVSPKSNMYVCGQVVNMCDSTPQLDYFISFKIRKALLTQLNPVYVDILIFVYAFLQLSNVVTCISCNQYCNSLNGSRL